MRTPETRSVEGDPTVWPHPSAAVMIGALRVKNSSLSL